MDQAQLESILRATMAGNYAPEEYDLVPAPATRELDLVTDEWTLHLERWPEGIAFLAIDDEPADRIGYAAARTHALGERGLRTLTALNAALGGTLVAALRRSGDPFAIDLADALDTTTA